jgi:uncharacterized membrane protein SpoIIM required for sporulation/uncharacterized RDD family membrane protein YckC
MSTLTDRHVEVETPEHVALSYALAGPGSRFAAFLIDSAILIGVLLAIMLTLVLLVVSGLPGVLLPTTLAIVTVAMFVIGWGYFVFFEGFREGQTPGKKRVGLRVVHEGGFPLTVRGAVIRNLLRIIDCQPFPSWMTGGIFIVLHPRAQRLGDLAAGTIVVQEQRAAALPEEAGAGPPRLSDQEFDILREYALRREGLERGSRTRVADKLVVHFAPYAADLPQARLLTAGTPGHSDALLSMLYSDESARRTAAGGRAGSGSPAAAGLLRRQRPRWARYDALLERARRSRLSSLSHDEVSQFAGLYREVASDLARARTYGASPELIYTLERAVGSGHNVLYSPPVRSARRAWEWLAGGFPALVRRRAFPILLAGVMLYGPAVAAFIAIVDVPARAPLILPAEMIARAEDGATRHARGEGYIDVPEVFMPLFSSGIIANNVQVTFFAFAGGIVVGLGTTLILLLNGVMLGGVAGLFQAEGLSVYLWSFVLPHGILELTAICIAGGAGLLLGSAFLVPGRRTRRDALVHRGRDAVMLLGGTVVMLILAGLIEGFISPSALPSAVKLAFGVLMAFVMSSYLLLSGRDAEVAGEPATAARAA